MPTIFSAIALLIAMALAGAGSGQDAQTAARQDLSSLEGATIAVDPGHNGGNASHPDEIAKQVPAGGFRKECDTTGTATRDGELSEHAFAWDTARRLKKLLEAQGAKVVLTRPNDSGVGPCIDRRAAIGNRAKADAAISLHADGGPARGRGFHVIYPGLVRGYTEKTRGPSRRLALDLRAVLTAAGLRRSDYTGKDGLDRRTDLGGLNLSTVPKVLAELGNMQNSRDAAKLKSRAWRQSTARALRDGLARYLARGISSGQ